MGKAFRLSRDVLIAFGLFFGGSLWLTLVWPETDVLFGAFMVLAATAGTAKINVRPFSDFGVLPTYRTYFPLNLPTSEFRNLGVIYLRFGLIAFLVPALCFFPAWVIVKEVEKMQGYAVMGAFLGFVALFFQIRGAFLTYKSLSKRSPD